VNEQHVLVDQVMAHQRLDQLSAAEDHDVLAGCSLSLATASMASSPRSVELLHGSGSASVVEATYF
jgi:hypothetical protein